MLPGEALSRLVGDAAQTPLPMLNTQLSVWLAGWLTLQISDWYLYCLSVFVSPGPNGGSVPAMLLEEAKLTS